jgi:GNAT superfamily N-acetyltransferase
LYTEEITGEVRVRPDEGVEDGEIIGKFIGYRLRQDWAAVEGVSFFDIADAFTQETYEYLMRVFDEEGEVRPLALAALREEPLWGPVLIAHSLELAPAHRGHGVGYLVVNAFLETFGPGCGIAIARAAPVRDGEPVLGPSRARGIRALAAYWKGLGFVSVKPDPGFLVMNLSLRRPPVHAAIPARRRRRAVAKRKRVSQSGARRRARAA